MRIWHPIDTGSTMELQLGELKIQKIYEMQFGLPMSMVFPQIQAADLAALREWYWSEELSPVPESAEVRMSVHSYVLQSGGKNILIDCCNGNDKPRDIPPFANKLQTDYLKNFKATGLTPEDIDVVLCTHLHGDHVGWNTRLENGRWVPTFPNARYLFTRADYEYFGRHTNHPIHGPGYLDSVLPVMEHGLADLVDTEHVVEHEIGTGVWLQPSPGHTPGNCMVHAQRRGDLAIFSGDTFHHPIELVRPDTLCFADEDAALAGDTRKRLFAQYADSSTSFFPAHFGGVSGGHIRRHRDAYRYEFLKPGRP